MGGDGAGDGAIGGAAQVAIATLAGLESRVPISAPAGSKGWPWAAVRTFLHPDIFG